MVEMGCVSDEYLLVTKCLLLRCTKLDSDIGL